ncbi:methyltransferase domain-containing protein [Solidesulfovibrio sp.]|uniref:SAM-dependent methyltransferase n=1 Tax=Solidesulfovibrio sp. TaxID=2910990 RepID=UPI00261DB01E|nr:methyltransferase domain-containing protein [Solidesulfovibrio sp.]
MEEHITSAFFDPAFVKRNLMGPNCLLLAEEFLGRIDLADAGRVLDLGCGTGLTSMYLASRLSARIVGYDLWIDATDNFERLRRHGFDDRVMPVHGDVDAMPFARGYFDALVCIDAYHHFGAREGFLETALAPFLRPGGLFAIVVPGLKKDFDAGVPEEMRPFWQEDMNMYSAVWWADLIGRSPAVRLEEVFSLACHDRAWREWLSCDHPYAVRDRDMMRAEAGQYFDTIGLVARVV